MSDAKKKTELASGMYECEMLKGPKKGETMVYHSSTASTLQDKGFLKVGKKIKKYVPKTMKK
jgi:hypothetical protein